MLLAEFPWQVFTSPFGVPIAGIIGVFGWLAVSSISEAVSKVMQNRNDTELKLELVARGFSAEQIARTVESGRPTTSPTPAQTSFDTSHS